MLCTGANITNRNCERDLENINKKRKGNAKPVPALKEYGESGGIFSLTRNLGIKFSYKIEVCFYNQSAITHDPFSEVFLIIQTGG
jgi:hypothetical protein